jgi:alkanesulfonate monooxygenase SsuD/methylene tetrahydromethanopterin reductase-like flavin-dependent oxidoreductase (luciferase family)
VRSHDRELKLGYFFTMDNPGHVLPYRQLLENATEQTRLIEQCGFDTVWMGEHHFGHEGFDIHPNPIITATHLATKTTDIRIGFAALICTQWHPLRLAEDVAMIDQLSGGRVECGFGRGISIRELVNLNPNADRRNEVRQWALFREIVDVVKRAWTEEPFTYQGLFYRFPEPGITDHHAAWYTPDKAGFRSEKGEYVGMSIIPKPWQEPHPPLWNVVDKTAGFVIAAEMGLKPITWLRSTGGLKEAFGAYRNKASEIQKRELAKGEECGLLRTAFVAETMEEARRIAEPAVEMIYKNYVAGYRSRDIYAEPGETLSDEDRQKGWFDFLFERDHLLIGSPEVVAEKILRLREETGVEALLTWMWLPGIEQDDILRSIELFGERVVPLIRDAVPGEPVLA